MYLGVHVKDYTLKYAPFSGYQTWQMEESEDITQIYFKTAVLPVPNLATIFASLRLKILLQASEQLLRLVSVTTTGAAENLVNYGNSFTLWRVQRNISVRVNGRSPIKCQTPQSVVESSKIFLDKRGQKK